MQISIIGNGTPEHLRETADSKKKSGNHYIYLVVGLEPAYRESLPEKYDNTITTKFHYSIFILFSGTYAEIPIPIGCHKQEQKELRMNYLIRPLVIVSLFSMSACADMSSQDILTSGIYADIVVTNNSNNSITVNTELTAGNGLFATYIDLEGGDRLDSLYLGAQKNMQRQGSIFGDISYKSVYTSSQPYSTDSQVTVSLYRTVHQNAPNSKVLLPDPISSLSLSSYTVSTGQNVTATWPKISGKSYNIEAKVVISGCVNDEGNTTKITSYRNFSDGGSYTFRVNDFLSSGYSCPTGGSGTLTISRIRHGTVDSAYDGGRIRAIYKRSVGFNIQ